MFTADWELNKDIGIKNKLLFSPLCLQQLSSEGLISKLVLFSLFNAEAVPTHSATSRHTDRLLLTEITTSVAVLQNIIKMTDMQTDT